MSKYAESSFMLSPDADPSDHHTPLSRIGNGGSGRRRGDVAAALRRKMTDAYAPVRLDVVDESHLHAGHAGASSDGETHFRIVAVAAAFEGAGSLERQRGVMSLLSHELAGPVHALSLRLYAPSEIAARSA